MNALPLLLIGGAAVLLVGKKKRRSSTPSSPPDEEPTPPGSGRVGGFIQRSAPSGSRPDAGQQQQQRPGGPSEPDTIEQAAAALCSLPGPVREEQAEIYAKIAVKGMRKAADSNRQSKRDKFPCNDPERLSWVVDEAFRLWLEGNPDAETTSKYWVEIDGKKKRPWNTMNAEESKWSLTALGTPQGMRHVQDKALGSCARFIRDLLTAKAISKCPGVSQSDNPFPWA